MTNTASTTTDSQYKELLRLKLQNTLALVQATGWKIFPVHGTWSTGQCLCGNPNCSSPGKHPAIKDWQGLASNNPTQITLWAQQCFGCNWGIPTGDTNRLLEIDVDNGKDKNGLKALAHIEQAYEPLPETFTTLTPRKGFHYAYSYPKGTICPGNKTNLTIPGWSGVSNIDIRGEGGYVVAPWSNIGLNVYTPTPLEHWKRRKATDAPEWLIKLINTPNNTSTHPDLKAELDDWDESIKGFTDGERNQKLFERMGRMRRSNCPITFAHIVADAIAIRANPPMDRAEARRTADSAYNYSWGTDHLGYTDDAFTMRLKRLHPDDLKYSRYMHSWYTTTPDGFWAEYVCAPYEHIDQVKGVLEDEYIRIADTTLQKTCRTAINRLSSPPAKENVLKTFRSKLENNLNFSELDTADNLIGLKTSTDTPDTNVLKHTSKGFKLIQAKPTHLLTKRMGTHYDQQAKSPRWARFIKEIQPNPNQAHFLHKLIGYTLLTSNPLQKAVFFNGHGANGKSVLLNILDRLFNDYAITLPSSAFTQHMKASVQSSHNEPLARAKGALVALCSETKAGDLVNEAILKLITGDDIVTARAPYGREAVTYKPRFLPIIATNDLPVIKGNSHAIWRRILVVEFPITFTQTQQDSELTATLIKELPGILNWTLDGLKMYHQEGLTPPQSVLDASSEYQDENDLLKDFMDDCVIRDVESWVPVENFLAAYVGYMYTIKQNKGISMTANSLTRILKSKRLAHSKKLYNTRGYQGLRLLQPNESSVGLVIMPDLQSKITACFPTADDSLKPKITHNNNKAFRHVKHHLQAV